MTPDSFDLNLHSSNNDKYAYGQVSVEALSAMALAVIHIDPELHDVLVDAVLRATPQDDDEE